ncbi:MAG: hypothetical protein WEA09_14740 [Gemmatimonadota bacterium]
MRPRQRFYLGTVVVPLTLGLWAAGYLVSGEAERLGREETRRVAATALTLMEREIDRVTRAPSAGIRRLPGDPTGPVPVPISPSDTVRSVIWYEDDFTGIVRYLDVDDAVVERRGRMEPDFLNALEEVAGYRGALYLEGIRRASTEPPMGPEELSSRLHFRLAIFPEGLPLEMDDTPGILFPHAPRADTPPAVTLLVSREDAGRRLLPTYYLPAVTLSGIFLAILGFLLLPSRGGPQSHDPAVVRHWRRAALGLVLLPLLLSWGALLALVQGSRAEARQGTVGELAQAMAFVRMQGEGLPLADLRAMTGFEVTRIQDGEILESTLSPSQGREALAARIPPPGPFTVTGRHQGAEREIVFMAGRLGPSVTVVLSTPPPESPDRSLGLRLLVLGGAMGILVLFFPLLISRHRWLRHLPGGSQRELSIPPPVDRSP